MSVLAVTELMGAAPDPATAQTTPAASKVPLSGLDNKIALGWIPTGTTAQTVALGDAPAAAQAAAESTAALALAGHVEAADPHPLYALESAMTPALAAKADLVDGKVPSTQLPAYVDDVLEYANLAAFPATGEAGKIYVALDTNLTYRWSGTVYTEISKSLALGELSSTAYAGDKGAELYALKANIPTASEKTRLSDIQAATGATTALKLANLASPASPTQQGVALLGASGGAARVLDTPEGLTDYASNFETVDGWTASAGGSASVAEGVLTFSHPEASCYLRRLAWPTVNGKAIGCKFKVSGTPTERYLKFRFSSTTDDRDINEPFVIDQWHTVTFPSLQGDKLYVWVGAVYTVLDTYAIEFEFFNYGTPAISNGNADQNALKKITQDYISPVEGGLILPPIYAIVGRECNVYFDNLLSTDANVFDWKVELPNGYGKQQAERYTYTPTAAASRMLGIYALDKITKRPVIASAVPITAVIAAAGSGTPKVLCIGDSTTAGGTVSGELLTLFATDPSMNIELVGTQGIAPNLHEGRSGWKASTFVGATSPFYKDGVIDFSAYIADNSLSGCDIAIIHLGINDMFASLMASSTALLTAQGVCTNIQALITSMQAYNANMKIGVALTIPPAYSQDGFGVDYGTVYNKYQYKKAWYILAKQILSTFGGRTANKIWLVPYSTALDTVHNMKKAAAAPWNSRTSETTERQNNGIHPEDIGYYQLTDVTYALIKSIS